MATATRAPTSDEAVSGTWSGSAGTRYTLVDDYPDSAGADVLTGGTTAAVITFGFSVFAIPANSTGISVQVEYYDGEAANGANNCGGRLKVGGNYYNAATHNPAGTTYTSRSDNWATNPKTTAAWTVDDINGVGANALQAFGLNSTDSNPTWRFASVRAQVTYTPPALGESAVTLGSVTAASDGDVEVYGTSSGQLAAVTGSAAGEVTAGGVSGESAATLGAIVASSAGAVEVQGGSTGTLTAVTGSAAGEVADPAGVSGESSATLGTVSGTAAGQVAIAGASAQMLGDVSGAATGQVTVQGTSTAELGAVNGSSAGAVTVVGSSAVTLQATGSATGAAPVDGTSSKSLSPVTGYAAGGEEEDSTAGWGDNWGPTELFGTGWGSGWGPGCPWEGR